jgi:hypothetical protein
MLLLLAEPQLSSAAAEEEVTPLGLEKEAEEPEAAPAAPAVSTCEA